MFSFWRLRSQDLRGRSSVATGRFFGVLRCGALRLAAKPGAAPGVRGRAAKLRQPVKQMALGHFIRFIRCLGGKRLAIEVEDVGLSIDVSMLDFVGVLEDEAIFLGPARREGFFS